jgi:hypothetical protein
MTMQRNERPLQHQEEQQEFSIDSPVSSRASSEPILSLLLQSPTGSPPPPLTKGGVVVGGGGTTSTGSSSMVRYGRSASETISPTSILLTPTTTPEFYAPSRRKRVSFVTEAFLKPPPIQQRLQGMNLADLDLGVSVCRAAVVVGTAAGAGTATGAAAVEPTHTGDGSHQSRTAHTNNSTSPTTTTTTASRKPRKAAKPTHVLERRLQRIQREYAEASFELEVGENDMNTLLDENEELRARIMQEEMAAMGLGNLEDSADELQRKIRKYTSKIATLTHAVEFYKSESAIMIEQLRQSKSLVRRCSKDRVALETIPEANHTSSTAA